MENVTALPQTKNKYLVWAQVTTLLLIAIGAPLLKALPLPGVGAQLITGTIVNSTLYLTVILVGWRSALMIGFLPSVVALGIGTLPMALAPMVPFIVIGNLILVGIFAGLYRKNFWLGVVPASTVKFLFLFGTSSLLSEIFLPTKLASVFAVQMSWPQLVTAVMGGIVAYAFYKKSKVTSAK
jgi:hypothetical protein